MNKRSLAQKYENLKKRGEKSVTNKRANINKNILRVQKLHARLANIRLEYVKSIVTNVVKTKPNVYYSGRFECERYAEE